MMELKIFDRKKYIESINILISRKAPSYVIEAYQQGFTKVVNLYYKIKTTRAITESKIAITAAEAFSLAGLVHNISMITEALKKRDEDFLKAFFVMTNLDIVTGKKLPPSAGRLLKDRGMFDSGLKELYKKLR